MASRAYCNPLRGIPKVDNIVSSSWEVMEHPVPIRQGHSDLSNDTDIDIITAEDSPACEDDHTRSAATYVATQQHNANVMDDIAVEFERHAQRRSQQISPSEEIFTLNTQHNANNEADSTEGQQISSSATTQEIVPQNITNQLTDSPDNQSRSPGLGLEQHPQLPSNESYPAGHTGTCDQEGISAQRHDSDERREEMIHNPTDDTRETNQVRLNRASQLRHTTSQNRQVHADVEQRTEETVNRNHSSVSHTRNERRRRHGERGTGREQPEDTASNMLYSSGDPSDAPPPVASYDNELHQKTLLELMTRGFRTFTTEMADVILDKLRPEYESFARHVGQEVKEATNTEIKELREQIVNNETKLKEIESENETLKEQLSKERADSKKEIEKEILKRAKVFQEQSAIITKLEGDIHVLQNTQKDKDKKWRKAETRAKAEELKRTKLEEEYEAKLKDMQKQLDKVKGDLLVQKSVKRLQTSSSMGSGGRVNSGKLISHHGGYKKHVVRPKHVPYDEGDP